MALPHTRNEQLIEVPPLEIAYRFRINTVAVSERLLRRNRTAVTSDFEHAAYIDNEPNPPVSKDRGAGDTFDLVKILLNAIDDNLLLSKNFIHHNRHPFPFRLQDEKNGLLGICILGLARKDFVQAHDRNVRASNINEFALADHGFDHFGFGLDRLEYGQQRHDVGFLADSHRHTVNDHQCERQFEYERGAFPLGGFDTDRPSQTFDVPLHHIHAHTTTRDVRYFLRGGKSWFEDQRPNLIIRRFIVLADQTLLIRLR